MSEQIIGRLGRFLTTHKHRELWRNTALLSWIIGIGPSMIAVCINGSVVTFAIMVTINAILFVANCSFCCITIETMKIKTIFYIICLFVMLVNDTVLITTFISMDKKQEKGSDNVIEIFGFVGCGLISLSCLAFAILNVLFIIEQTRHPGKQETSGIPHEPADLPLGFIAIRYVSFRKRMRSSGKTFQVVSGQILQLPQVIGTTVNSEDNSQPSAPVGRRASCFGFRARSRERENDARNMPIRIITDGFFNSQRRGSTISLLRRPSVDSIEYNTETIRCTCFCLPDVTEENQEEAPSYTEAPSGNVSDCPIHGTNSIIPPPYESFSAYNTLCSVLGLPKYDEVTISKPCKFYLESEIETEYVTIEAITPTAITPTAITPQTTPTMVTPETRSTLTQEATFPTIAAEADEYKIESTIEEMGQ